MFSSPKAYIEDLLTEVISEYVDSFEDSSINLGLWNGDVGLSNVVCMNVFYIDY